MKHLITGFFVLTFLNSEISLGFDIFPNNTKLNVDNSQVINPAYGSKVILTSFKSFSCPPCKSLEKDVIQHVKSYFQDDPRVSFAMKWAKIGSNDLTITKRVLCGSRAFVPVSLLSHLTYKQTLSDEQILALGAYPDIYQPCMSSSEATSYVENDFRDLGRVGVSSVPTLFLNEKRISRPSSADSLISQIEDLLK